MPVITSLADLNFRVDELSPMPFPKRVLMVEPNEYDVLYVINPHMEGKIGTVDFHRAHIQWQELRDIYEQLGLEVITLKPGNDLPDMVFCANQSLPFCGSKGPEVLMSKMHADQRKKEVELIEKWYAENDYSIHHLPDSICELEGMGDALWHSGRRLIWGGYGYRTQQQAHDFISQLWDVPIIALELQDPAFYHLDTCMCILDETHALIYPPAFKTAGVEAIHHMFPHVIEATDHEARNLFACNATCPDGQHVIIQRGCVEATQKLKRAGFTVIEVETGEYLKGGGSVFCMKMLVW